MELAFIHFILPQPLSCTLLKSLIKPTQGGKEIHSAFIISNASLSLKTAGGLRGSFIFSSFFLSFFLLIYPLGRESLKESVFVSLRTESTQVCFISKSAKQTNGTLVFLDSEVSQNTKREKRKSCGWDRNEAAKDNFRGRTHKDQFCKTVKAAAVFKTY